MEDNYHTQKEHILLQSSQALLEGGIRSFTVDAFSKQLRISKKTIYKYFPTKEILLEESIEYFVNRINTRIQQAIQMEENPVIRFINMAQIILSHISHISADRMADLKIQHPKAWMKIETFRLNQQDHVKSLLLDGQNKGFVRKDIPPEKTATLLINLINSTFQPEFFIRNNFAPDEAMRLFLNIITSGLFTKKGINIIKKEI